MGEEVVLKIVKRALEKHAEALDIQRFQTKCLSDEVKFEKLFRSQYTLLMQFTPNNYWSYIFLFVSHFFLFHVFKIKLHGKQWYTPISGWRSHTSVTKRHSGAWSWADIMWTTNVLGETICCNRFRFNSNDLLVLFDILLIQWNLNSFLERAEKALQLSPRIYRLHMNKIQQTYSNHNQI